jgi:hypothetical protein
VTGLSKGYGLLNEFSEIRVQAFNDSSIGMFLDHVSLLMRILFQIVQFVEFGMLNPMNQLVRIGPNSSVVGIQNPWKWSVIAVVFDENRGTPRSVRFAAAQQR